MYHNDAWIFAFFLTVCYYLYATQLHINNRINVMSDLQEKIFNILIRAEQPLTVQQIITQLKRYKSAVHKTTVYRNLDKLLENHSIVETIVNHDVVHYEVQKKHHHHAQCQKCHKILCVDSRRLETEMTYIDRLLKNHGFNTTQHHITISGLCETCK